ncbi:MAG TPA: DUF2283 domain-containing protein [Patescibacteria group bacterium]|nr:DUF2283 domain-containing protein [Patescibacteria group bacterium]
MATKKPKISYDSEGQILSIRLSSKKSIDSDIYGNVVIDYGEDGHMVNVDIMDISLSEFKREPAIHKLIPVMG